MDEFASLRNWDLEAIVRGSTGEATTMDDPNPDFSYFFSEQDAMLDTFPEFSETTRVLDDLEELYKPFYPVFHPLSPHTIVKTSLPIPIEPEQVKELKASEEKVALQGSKVPAAPKCKKSKKSQNKSVVKQVTTAEGLDDAWAWRKYGQKPIKGSPYPRSYYRCSSSKGCLARKQVERSHLDPSAFLVTYTAEHSHPHPTRRNSLAGTTRKNNTIVPPPTTRHQKNCSSRTPLVVKDNGLVPSVPQCMDLKKEDDFLEWLDDEGAQFGDGWIPTSDLEKLIGLECQHFAFDGGFTDGFSHA
ncbi:probable WRKY transcription factor 29 [Cajanus cajan]|uniref:WRKY transcription factor 29 n=1 Tax=Cajanus cajan TaxID=3821 RepID=A0A151SV58_CAJCA|nr:probable WRKY transcription factor 29 [Cajanus cajan]KYP58649.1 putative WRKY transcription factor 29 [Cajanus cajan]